jgi:hypothetical protein
LLDWGATTEEAEVRLPCDDLVPDADLVATQAIYIAAPPALVWSRLIQIGIGRAGAYSYDWLERLVGLDVHSSHHIVPDLQRLDVGDVVPVEQDGRGLRVHASSPSRCWPRGRATATGRGHGCCGRSAPAPDS